MNATSPLKHQDLLLPLEHEEHSWTVAPAPTTPLYDSYFLAEPPVEELSLVETAVRAAAEALLPPALPQKKERTAVTEELVVRIQAQLPAIDAKTITITKLAQEINLSRDSVSRVIKKLKNKKVIKKPSSVQPRKPLVRTTPAHIEQIKQKLPLFAEKQITIAQLVEETQLSTTSIRRIIKALNAGENPPTTASVKPFVKTTIEHVTIVEKHLSALKKGTISIKALRKEIDLSEGSIEKIIRRLKSGEPPTAIAARKKRALPTKECIQRIQKELQADPKGTFDIAILAKETNVTKHTIRKIIRELQNGTAPESLIKK